MIGEKKLNAKKNYTCQIKRNRETIKKRAIGEKTIRDGNSVLIVWSAHCESCCIIQQRKSV